MMSRSLYDAVRTKVVVGVDGSPQSRRAVRWAAAEAVRRRARLYVVHAYPVARQHAGTRGERAAEDRAERVFATAFDDVQRMAPDLIVTGRAVAGGAAEALLDAAEPGGVVVVGNKGHSELAAFLAGSTCQQVATHSGTSVAVVRGRPSHHDGPVVVGCDGSAGARPPSNGRSTQLRRVVAR